MKNQRTGTYVRLSYIGPRKRKAVPWGMSADTLDVALNRAKEWLSTNGGKFISGYSMPCSLYDIESNGELITMQSVALFAPGTVVSEETIQSLNGV